MDIFDFDVSSLFGDNEIDLEIDGLDSLDMNLDRCEDGSQLVDSAMEAARLNGLPPPVAIVDVPGLDNSAVGQTEDLDFCNDVRFGDAERVGRQEAEYGDGGSLPESLHEEAHRLPRIGKGIRTQYGPQAEEVVCDIRAGMLSGWAGAPRDAFRGEIGETEGDPIHPVGSDRVQYFEEAYDLAAKDPFKDFVHPDRNPLLRDKIRAVESRAVREFGAFNLYA